MSLSNDAGDQCGQDWQRLRDELAAWLRSRFPRVDAMNIAGDAMLLAMLRFGGEPTVAWGRVWRWLCRTAVNRVYYDHRRAKRCEVALMSEVEVPSSIQADGGSRALRLVEEALLATRGIEHQVLMMLRAGSPTNAEMAASLGVVMRTIERARMRLRQRFSGALRIRISDVGPEHL